MTLSIRLAYPSDYDLLWLNENLTISLSKLTKQILLSWNNNKPFNKDILKLKEKVVEPTKSVKLSIYLSENSEEIKIIKKLEKLKPRTRTAFIKYIVRKNVLSLYLESAFFKEDFKKQVYSKENTRKTKKSKKTKSSALTSVKEKKENKENKDIKQKPRKIEKKAPSRTKITIKNNDHNLESDKLILNKPDIEATKTEKEETPNDIFSFVGNLM